MRYREHDLATADDRRLTSYRREHVGFVFQFYNLVPSLTARENVALAAEIAPHPIPAEEALARVGLSSAHGPLPVAALRRRTAARGHRPRHRQAPDVLLCDEPTGALDVATGSWCSRSSTERQPRAGHHGTVITHNAAIADMADRVVRIADGRIARES